MSLTNESTKDKIMELVREANPDNPIQYVTDIVKNFALEKLNDKIYNCNICGCYNQKTYLTGNPDSEILIIKDIPNHIQFENNNNNSCYFNGYENNMYEIFKALNIDPNTLLYCNCINCLMENNRLPNKQEISNCYKNIIGSIIKTVNPKAILLFGSVPVKMFFNTTLMTVRGQLLEINGIPTVATYSLSYFEKIKDFKEQSIIESEYNIFTQDIYNFFDYCINTLNIEL